MAKKKATKKEKVPKTRGGNTLTEGAFWSFIRSGLRQKSRRWAPIYQCLADARRKSEDTSNPRLKWQYKCAICGEWRPQKEVAVDHIIPCGSLRSYADLPGFVERLFCEKEHLRVLCDACHLVVTNKKE